MKKFSAVLLSAVIGLSLVACANKTTETTSTESTTNNSQSEAASEEKVETNTAKANIIVGDVQWNSVGTLLESAGISDPAYKLDVSVFDGGNLALEALTADQIDIARTSEIPPLFAAQAADGGNFQIIAVLSDRITTVDQEVLVGPDSEITSVAELKGKKIGYTKATTAHYFLYEFLKDAGLTFDDVEVVEINPSDGAAALLSGDIDAFASFGNGIVAAKENGAKVIADGNDKLSGYFPIVVAKSALENEDERKAVIEYIADLNQAYQWIGANPDSWAEVSAEPSGKTVEKSLADINAGLAQTDSKIVTINDDIINSTQRIADVFYELGVLEKEVDASSIYTDAYSAEIEAAIAARQ
jgi:sulfonate transport system substrate-binding protein